MYGTRRCREHGLVAACMSASLIHDINSGSLDRMSLRHASTGDSRLACVCLALSVSLPTEEAARKVKSDAVLLLAGNPASCNGLPTSTSALRFPNSSDVA